MSSPKSVSFSAGLFFWSVTCLFEIASMYLRHLNAFAYFPENIGEHLIYILIIAGQSLIFAGLGVFFIELFSGLLKTTIDKILGILIPIWIIYLCTENLFLLRIEKIMGRSFNFFQFAEDVGGISNMLSDAWSWYAGDIICISISILVITIISFAGYRVYLKKKKSESQTIAAHKLVLIILLSAGMSIWLMGPCSWVQAEMQNDIRNHSVQGALCYAIARLGYHEKEIIPNGAKWLDAQTKSFIESYSQPLNMSFAARRNIFIILLESTRYDMLDLSIDGQQVMPELNKWLSRGAIRVDHAYSALGFTKPSVSQTFWGGYVKTKNTLIDDFKLMNYQTAVFSSDNMDESGTLESTGCKQSADFIVDGIAPSRDVMDTFEKYISEYDSSQPIFGYLFFQDPHFPYQTNNPNVLVDRPLTMQLLKPQYYARVWRSYANQVYHADVSVGRFFDILEKKQILENSLIIIISDHGEAIYDHGNNIGHGTHDISMVHGVMAVYGSQIDVSNVFTHADIRSFIYANLATPDLGQKSHLKNVDFPAFLYSGEISEPDDIIFQYPDGHRVGYIYHLKRAWIESDLASYPGEKVYKKLPSSEKMPIDYEVNVPEDLIESDLRRAPLSVNTPEVQNLIHYWQYLRHTQLQVSHEK